MFPARRVGELLRYAREHVPYYQDRFAFSRRATPWRYEDFSDLPFLKKEALVGIRENPARFLSDEVRPDEAMVESTSGTSGLPLECCKTKRERIALGLRAWSVRRWWWESVIGKKAIALGPRFGSQIQEVRNNLMLSTHNLSSAHMRKFCEQFERFQPEWLLGSASAIYQLCLYLQDNPRFLSSLSLKFIELQGEFLLPEYVREIARVFKCGVGNQYGCTELWVIAYSCPSGRLHIIEDDVFMEIVDQDGKPCLNGETGTVVVTGLKVRSMPFIRYRLGDRARFIPQPCVCGRPWRTIELLGCRSHQTLVLPDGRQFDGSVFHHLLVKSCGGLVSPYVRRFKVIQRTATKVEFYFSKGPRFDAASRNFKRRFINNARQAISGTLQVGFHDLASLPSSDNAKFMYFESKVLKAGFRSEPHIRRVAKEVIDMTKKNQDGSMGGDPGKNWGTNSPTQ